MKKATGMFKKMIPALLTTLFFLHQRGTCQSADSIPADRFKPYIGAGSAISNGMFTHGAELGIYNSKAWYALGFSNTEGGTSYGSFKAYYRIHTASITDLFTYGSVNIALDKTKSLSFEPGFAAVFNITRKLAPQVSFGLPVYENTQLFNPVNLSFGLSLNYWIK
jgi:hypothetical protein